MTKKDREREQARRERSRAAWHRLESPDADPQVVLVDELPNGTPAVIFCRTSSRNGKDQKLEGQVEGVIEMVEKAGLQIAAVVAVQETAKANRMIDRNRFLGAVEQAVRMNAALVAATPSRFLRHSDYHPANDPDDVPTEQDWKDLKSCVRPTLAVCYTPNSNVDDVNFLSSMGMRFDPSKKRNRLRNTARKLHEQGMGYRNIAKQLQERYGEGVSHMTVKRLLQG